MQSATRKPGGRRVLVVVDPTASLQPALAKGVRLAATPGSRLTVYACDFHEGLAAEPRSRPAQRLLAATRREYLTAGHELLRALARRHGAPMRRSQVVFEVGSRREAQILAYLRRARPDLVVKDSHFHPEARRSLFGAADWPLIRACPVPLLYAKPRRWRAAPRIAVAVDPGHPHDAPAALDRRLVATAVGLAHGLRGSLQVVHAYLPLEPALAGATFLGLPGVDASSAAALVADTERRARQAVVALLRGLRAPRPAVVLLRGAALETLPGFAELEDLDVLVMGAVARSRAFELLLGATAERLLERVACDVLIVNASRRRR